MTKQYRNYIDGEWVEAASGQTCAKLNPANGKAIAEIPSSGSADTERAVESAKRAFARWSKTPVPARGEIVRRFADLLTAHKEEVARIETVEMGKVLAETRGDVQEGIDTAIFAVGESRRLYGRTTPSELPNKLCFTVRRPRGVVALITPWNFPAALPCWKLLPALLCGNTVVFKPSREAPCTATRLVELLVEAGVPEGVVNLVHGPGSAVGGVLCSHPDVSLVSFTGSVSVGRQVGAAAGERLKKVSLELGGKNGQIVMDDADLDLAVEGALWGAFGTTGQRCTATSRLIAHEAIHDDLVSRLAARANAIRVGDGLDETVDMGPLVSAKRRDETHAYVESARAEGAQVACGGEPCTEEGCGNGFFYKPTVLTGVEPRMRVAREEIFGPVLATLKVRDLQEAIEVINDSDFGLSSSIFTRDVNAAMRAVEGIQAGVVYVNSATIGAECHLPFGGVKNSGNGHREGGWAAYDLFSAEHAVYVDYSGKLQKAQIDTAKGE